MGKGCVLGETGGLGKSARQGSLGVIKQFAAAAAPSLVTAAVPRDLRVDPCERKSKRDEPGRAGQRSVDSRERWSREHDRSTFYSGNAAAKFAKMCGFE